MSDWRKHFDEIDAQVQDELAVRRRAAAMAASGRNPEQYARANSIADRRQMPVDIVADNLADFEEQERAEAFETLAREHPQVQPFLSDPRRMTLARDDADGLTKLARSIRDGVVLPWLRVQTEANRRGTDVAGEAVRGLYGGIGRGMQGLGDLIDAGAYAASRAAQGEEAADSYMRASRQAAWWENPSQALRIAGGYVERGLLFQHTNLRGQFDPLDEGRRNFATDVSGGLGNLGGQVMASAVNPLAGVGLMAGQGAQQQGERADAAGASESERAVAVTAGGAITAALEKVGLNKLLERLPPKVKSGVAQWIADKATAAAIEGTQEGAEQIANNAVARVVYAPEAELFEGAGDNATVGAAVGGIARAILFPGRQRIDSPRDDEALRVLRSVDAAGRLEQITAAGADSKLAQLSPADAQAFAQALAGDGRVYLPAAEAMRLFQSDERLLSDLVGGSEVLAEQLAGGDLSIPMAKWVGTVARLPNVDEIQHHARLDPDGLSPDEIEQRDAMDAELFGATDEAAARAVPAAVESRQQVVDDVMGQLSALGRFTPVQAEAQAKLWGAAFATMGQRAGADPFALYQRYMLGIRNAGAPSPLASRPFVETARLDAVIESVRRGSTDPAAAGQSLTQWLRGKGGIIDEGGELADFDARIAVPGLVSRAGMSLDRAREAAAEAGYIEDGGTIADFLDAIDRDIRNGDVLSEKMGDVERAQFERERQDIIAAIQDNPRLRDMPPSEFARLSNQDVIDALFGGPDVLNQGAAGGNVGANGQPASNRPELAAYETMGAVGGRAPAPGWAAATRIRDKRGVPARVFRGSRDGATSAESFGQVGAATGHPSAGLGVWFSSDKADASRYGTVGDYHLDLRKPKIYNSDTSPEFDSVEEAVALRRKLQAAGHDGIVFDFRDIGGPVQMVAFAPDQVILPATTLRQSAPTQQPAEPEPRSLIERAVDGVRTLFQGKSEPPPETTRGQISIFPDRRMSIELFERADRTTFLHESGHFFFEVMRDLATAPDAAPDLVADFEALRTWMGAEPGAELSEDQLETFARGFEAYLGEGKAPSPELQSVFSKFAAWIVGVYRTLRNLNAQLTDDVRSLFDRMLATEDEIAAAQARQGMAPLPIDPAQGAALGLTDKQFTDYVAMTEAAAEEARAEVRQKLLASLERERKAWWKEGRAKVQAEVSERYEATPAVRALRILSGRRSVNGVEVPEDLRGLKLNREAVVAGYGEAYLKRLGRTYAAKGGVSPDEAAAALGFASGDDLLRAVANAPDTIVRVEAETDAIMRERHGDPMTDGTLAEVAMAAVHNDKRVQVLERELGLLAQLAGQPAPSRRVTKALAERRIAAKTARQVRPNDYLVAERRAAREAANAAARGDYAEALAAKRRQAVNVAMYSAARDATARFERQVRYLQRMETSGRRARLGKAGGEYLEQVDALLEAVELRPASGPQLERRRRLAEWVARMEKEGRPINVPPRLLYETGLTNLRDMPLQEVAGLVDTIKQIEHLAKTKTRLFDGRQERDRAEVDAEMAAAVQAAHGERPERTGDELLPEKVRRMVADIDIARLQPTNIARELDGYAAGGPVWTNLILPIRRAIFERVQPEMRKMQEDVAALYAKHYQPEELRRLDAPVFRPQVRDQWSKGRILALAMHWGSSGNREAILTQAQSRISEAQAVDLLRTLDARDWAFVQAMVDKVNSYWPEIAAAQRRRTGLVPEKVEAAPFTITTAGGQVISVRGGYFPLQYDAERSGFGVSREEADDIYNDLRVGKTARAATRHGHTIERVGSGGRAVRLDLDLATSHMRSVIRDLHLGDAVAYVHDVLNGQEFTKATIAAGRRAHLQALELWLKDVAAGEMGGRHVLEKVAAHVRMNTTAAVLTWKPVTALLQVTGFVQSASVIGNRAMLTGIRRLLSKSWIRPNSIFNDIRARSPFMVERFGTLADQVEAVANARAGRLKSAQAAMIRWGYVPMARMQMIVDAATWLAAESAGLKMFDGDPEKARAYADDLVVRAQSSSEFLDKSQLQRGTLNENLRQSEVIRATTMLQSYMMTKGNIVREKYQLADLTRPGDVFKFGVDMIQLFAVEAMIIAMIRNGLPDDGDDEDGDGMVDEWATWLAKEVALGNLSTLPGASPLATEWRGFTAQGPTERAWGSLADATGAWFDGELDRKDLRSTVNVAGVASGIPSSQINTTSGALWRVHDGEDVSPLDYIERPEKPRD